MASRKTLSSKTIIVSENTIESIENGFVSGTANDGLINLKDKTVLPGFIDMHVHMESEFNPQVYIKRKL